MVYLTRGVLSVYPDVPYQGTDAIRGLPYMWAVSPRQHLRLPGSDVGYPPLRSIVAAPAVYLTPMGCPAKSPNPLALLTTGTRWVPGHQNVQVTGRLER